MQDWEKAGKSSFDNSQNEQFSWENAKKEAMKQYSDYIPDKAYKYEPKPSKYGKSRSSDSIFHSPEPPKRRSGNYNPGSFGPLKYDYPGDNNTYEKYSPKSAYDDSIFINAEKQSARNAAQSRPKAQQTARQKPKNGAGKNNEDKKAAAAKANKNNSKKKQSIFSLFIKKRSGNQKQNNKNANNPKAKNNTQHTNQGAQGLNRRPNNKQSAGQRPSNDAQKKKAYERERKARETQRKKVQRSHETYINKTASGISADELRKRRSKKAKRTGKFYAVISVCALLFVAGMGVLIYCFAHGAPIEKITVKGLPSIYTQDEVLKIADISKGDNMFLIRQNKTDKTVSKALPYIEHVEVDYELPSTLNLIITETKEKYLIANGSNYICVDRKDKIVSDKKKKINAGQYRLDGFEKQDFTVGETFVASESNKKRYETAKNIVEAIEKSELKKCSSINLSNLDEISIVCDSQIKIYVESGSDFERVLKLAKLAIESKVKTGGKYYIDLRYSNRAVMNDGDLK